ncbi:MAG TPA: carboxypeptidase regulatory-like domain-containing protein, partial [Verrucomicrobiae bacterium]|nr:carboxypeptidase regulatory-like domain-containing protein [Verrucomicrobiae bacterium]
ELGKLQSGRDVYFAPGTHTTASDAEGNFTLPNLPPGDGQVEIRDTDGKSVSCVTPVQVPAGETLHLQLGGTGATISGRLVAPAGVTVKDWPGQISTSLLTSKWESYGLPEDLRGEAQWRWQMAWSETAEGRARLRSSVQYQVQVRPDGSFTVPEVLPGSYHLLFHLIEAPLASGPATPNREYNRLIAQFGAEITVPEASSGASSAIDLGDLAGVPAQ